MAEPAVRLVLTAAFAGTLITAAQGRAPLPIKVVVVTTFEHGSDVGDRPGEFQFWVERERLDTVLPFPAGFRDLRLTAQKGILGMVTGPGVTNATASVMALGTDTRFDLCKAYWCRALVAAATPDPTLTRPVLLNQRRSARTRMVDMPDQSIGARSCNWLHEAEFLNRQAEMMLPAGRTRQSRSRDRASACRRTTVRRSHQYFRVRLTVRFSGAEPRGAGLLESSLRDWCHFLLTAKPVLQRLELLLNLLENLHIGNGSRLAIDLSDLLECVTC
jgi:hypothetical protein